MRICDQDALIAAASVDIDIMQMQEMWYCAGKRTREAALIHDTFDQLVAFEKRLPKLLASWSIEKERQQWSQTSKHQQWSKADQHMKNGC